MSEIKDDFNVEEIYEIINKKSLKKILNKNKLENSKYGISHIGRVIENGLLLSDYLNSNSKIVILFAIFSVAARENEEYDPDYGLRAANLVKDFENKIKLEESEIEELENALIQLSIRKETSSKTINACLDALELDSMINGIYPNKEKMNTEYAKNAGIITWAMKRGMNNYSPIWIENIID